MASNMNQPDLSALLAAGGPPSAASLLLGGSSQLPGLSGPGTGGAGGPDGLAAAAARSNSLLSSLLLQRQAEEQQKVQIAQQLSALEGAPMPGFPPSDNLALLLHQQQQLKQLQALSMPPTAGTRLLGLGTDLAPVSTASLGLGRGLGGMPGSVDSAAISKLLQVQGSQSAASPMALELHRAALLGENGALPLPPDRRRKGRTGTFPQKLHQMLSDLERQEGGSEIASFLPHGRAFAIHKPREFVKQVMTRYFRMSRFSSFQRQLNLYDFQRITEGPDKGAYFHELFVPGRPILSTMMKRNKIKGVKNLQQKEEDSTKKEEEEGDENNSKEGEEEEEEEPAPEEKNEAKKGD